jgi:hypothetical protein
MPRDRPGQSRDIRTEIIRKFAHQASGGGPNTQATGLPRDWPALPGLERSCEEILISD